MPLLKLKQFFGIVEDTIKKENATVSLPDDELEEFDTELATLDFLALVSVSVWPFATAADEELLLDDDVEDVDEVDPLQAVVDFVDVAAVAGLGSFWESWQGCTGQVVAWPVWQLPLTGWQLLLFTFMAAAAAAAAATQQGGRQHPLAVPFFNSCLLLLLFLSWEACQSSKARLKAWAMVRVADWAWKSQEETMQRHDLASGRHSTLQEGPSPAPPCIRCSSLEASRHSLPLLACKQTESFCRWRH